MPYVPSDEECPENPLIESGTYRVEITMIKEVDEDGAPLLNKSGDKYWGMCLIVRDTGEFTGLPVWDNIIFSQKQSLMRRTKDILNKFGIDTSKGVKLDNSDILLNRQAKAEIYIDEFDGKKRNKVGFFGGYHKLADDEKSEDDIPL